MKLKQFYPFIIGAILGQVLVFFLKSLDLPEEAELTIKFSGAFVFSAMGIYYMKKAKSQ